MSRSDDIMNRMYPALWQETVLYDPWPTKVADTVDGLAQAADQYEARGEVELARNIRKGLKAFEGRS